MTQVELLISVLFAAILIIVGVAFVIQKTTLKMMNMYEKQQDGFGVINREIPDDRNRLDGLDNAFEYAGETKNDEELEEAEEPPELAEVFVGAMLEASKMEAPKNYLYRLQLATLRDGLKLSILVDSVKIMELYKLGLIEQIRMDSGVVPKSWLNQAVIYDQDNEDNYPDWLLKEFVYNFSNYFEKEDKEEVKEEELKKPWDFCETPEDKCTMNYCDENGCQNRKRELVDDSDLKETIDSIKNTRDNIKDEITKYDESEGSPDMQSAEEVRDSKESMETIPKKEEITPEEKEDLYANDSKTGASRKEFMTVDELRAFCKQYNIKNLKALQQRKRIGEHEDIPSSPAIVYRKRGTWGDNGYRYIFGVDVMLKEDFQSKQDVRMECDVFCRAQDLKLKEHFPESLSEIEMKMKLKQMKREVKTHGNYLGNRD